MINKENIAEYFKQLQDSICAQLEKGDGQGIFQEDQWTREGGGGGRSRVIMGEHIAKGGVNFSAVHGPMPEKISNALKIEAGSFFATGVSIVLHPDNPWVPIIHMNVRYFEMDNGLWWFGGGIDLTPHFIVKEEARFFHQQLKSVCDRHHPDFYPRFKKWADDYFFLKHRDETRGVGGIFFDDLNEPGFDACFEFVRAAGDSFLDAYSPIAERRRDIEYGNREREFQLYRRGRYVEFNLIYDRGTLFGLQSGGRTESILMSLPPAVRWQYNWHPESGSKEAELYNEYLQPRDWLGQTKS